MDNSAAVEDHTSQMTQWDPGCNIYNITFCGSLRFKQSRSCEFYARDEVTGEDTWCSKQNPKRKKKFPLLPASLLSKK